VTDPSTRAVEEDSPGVVIPPGAWYLACLAAGYAVDIMYVRSPGFPSWLSFGAGSLLSFVGAGMFLTARITLRLAGTDFDPQRPSSVLVTHGIYRLSRNPIYLGLSILYSGLSLLGSCLWALALLPVLILLIMRFLILPEERYLLRRFGHAYADYRARVRRWL
jgi:protein-S-isoprenylcysteine O-methyltransferase Ste14